MAKPTDLDPFEAWRQLLGQFESNFNSMANENMQSEPFRRALGQFSDLSTGMRQSFDKALDKYFQAMRVPTQKDIQALADRLDRIEDKLDTLALGSRPPAVDKPKRTRKPPTQKA